MEKRKRAFVKMLASCLRVQTGGKTEGRELGGRLENARRQGRHLENPINQVRVGDGGGCAAVVTEGRPRERRGAKGARCDSERAVR